MSEHLEIGVEGNLGVIALNRPEAINALTTEMVTAISGQLDAWRFETRIRAVLFEGRGPKGFCAGGDVRRVRAELLAGRTDAAFGFFEAEYAMNARIAGFTKPVVALCTGAVMGGGLGIAGHARYRFATPAARFAMPEGAIGFFCDVGSNAILALAPLHRALLFLLCGLPVTGGDALMLGLTDCIVPEAEKDAVRKAVVAAASRPDPEQALVALMQSTGIEPGESPLCAAADRLAHALDGSTASEIVADVSDEAAAAPELAPYANALRVRCPASLEAILQSQRAARQIGDLAAVLALDLRLARLLAPRNDFVEGVRAVLVERDNTPKWSAEVPSEAIAAQIAA